MPENKKEAAKANDQVFVVKIHKILGTPSILGFVDDEKLIRAKAESGKRYDFYKLPVEKL